MPGPEDAQEGQLALLLERAALLAGHVVGRQARGPEGGLPVIRDRLRGRLAAEPVADPIGVAGPDDRLHTA